MNDTKRVEERQAAFRMQVCSFCKKENKCPKTEEKCTKYDPK
jgi:hypothetical protein